MSSQQPTSSGGHHAAPVCMRKQMHKAKRVVKRKAPVKPEDLKIREIMSKQFRRVTENDVKKFSKQYKGSEEELEDIRKAWINSKGKLSNVIENVMCAEEGDEPRIQEIIRKLIQNKMAPRFKNGPESKWLTANMASKQSRGRSKTPERSSKKFRKSKSPAKTKARGSRKRSTSRSKTGRKATRRSRRR